MDHHEAVKIGDLEKSSEAIKVARPNFTTVFHAVVREGANATMV